MVPRSTLYPLTIPISENPNLDNSGRVHKPFFVTTGAISDPVINRVRNHNASWKKRKYSPLHLIGGKQLFHAFANLSLDFWPVEPRKIRSFLGLYLSEGKGDFDKPEFATFVKDVLTT